LYNAFLASTGSDGKSFFYVNPLESHGGVHREPWYWCACCPPNVMRTMAGLPGWFASTTKDTLYIHLFDDCTIDATLGDGRKLKVKVETRWPWDGKLTISVLDAPGGVFDIAVRRSGALPVPVEVASNATGGLFAPSEASPSQPPGYVIERFSFN